MQERRHDTPQGTHVLDASGRHARTRWGRPVPPSLLGRAGQTEGWLLDRLHLERLDDVPYARAEQVIRRLGELARDRSNARPCE